MNYYEVAPTQIIRKDAAVFTYSSETSLTVGQLVVIEVGKRHIVGVVMRQTQVPKEYATKPVTSLIDMPPLPQPLVEVALWMSDYYVTHLATVLQTVLPRGIQKKRRERQTLPQINHRERTNFLLNEEQLSAVSTIDSMSSGTALLYGITGSGKTAVYIELAKRAIHSGQSVIILVPEIALTAQVIDEFTNVFSDVIVTHSRQSEAERHLAWMEALTSFTPRIVIGPRSALFMPLQKIGLIIIDESHEPSYKQDQSPRYSALRVASILTNKHHTKLVLGSATPLITDYYLAKESKRPIIQLTKPARNTATKPVIELIDMTNRSNFKKHRFLSDTLLQKTQETLDEGHQVLLFHNRRGSAPTTLCENCGWTALCERCFIPLTLHADKHRLECHICGAHSRIPTSCPECMATEIIHKGIGTKLIESEVRKLFPHSTIARFDGDNTSSDSIENRYSELYNGSINIIIGTQVIAKGLDLPKLRTVGIVQADAGLSLPDYTASERTFQLLAQAIGRVGRSELSSSVIVQSYQPTHPSVVLGLQQDYASFYKIALAERKQAIFPPFCHLLKLVCVYKTERAAVENAQKLAATLRRIAGPEITILGPTPAFHERQRDTYRWQLVIKSPKRAALVNLLDYIPPTHWQYELDPLSLL